jgi:hexosaminidase
MRNYYLYLTYHLHSWVTFDSVPAHHYYHNVSLISLPAMYIPPLCLWASVLLSGTVLALWPMPTTMESGSEVYWLSDTMQVELYCGSDAEFYFGIDGINSNLSGWQHCGESCLQSETTFNNPSTNVPTHSEHHIIQTAIHRTLRSIKETEFVPWKFHPRHAAFEPNSTKHRQLASIKIIQMLCPTISSLEAPRFFGGDESYKIEISNETALVTSNSSLGTLRALQTIEQLFYAHSSGIGSYIPNTPISIIDKPKWSHRGLSLDIARNAFSPKDVMRTIEAMATAKMSRLHVHATDSQSWPIEIPALPELATKGAYQSNLIWSTADLKEVQIFGLERGISVYIEIDMPGHTASIAQAYPDLIAAFNEPDWSTFAAEPLSGQLKLNSSAVYDVLDTLFSDLLPRLTPFSTLYHGGGDEVNQMVYLFDETVRSNDSNIIQPLLQKFMDFCIDQIHKAGLQPVVWEEMLLDWNLTLPSANNNIPGNDVIIQVWRDSEHVAQVLEKGHHVLFGDCGHWYLDCGYGGFINPYPSGESPVGVPFNTPGGYPSQIKDPFLDYCNPYKNWRHIYMYDPLANISSSVQHLIEGGEVLLWSEQTDPINMDAKLWPRAAAAAEVLWSGPREIAMIEGASKRLGEWRERVVVDNGVGSGPVQMTWCLMQGGCDL